MRCACSDWVKAGSNDPALQLRPVEGGVRPLPQVRRAGSSDPAAPGWTSMKTVTTSLLFLALITPRVALAQPPAPPPFAALRPIYPDIKPARSCESLKELTLANTTIESALADNSAPG